MALSIDLRVQAALQDEVRKAAQTFRALGAVGIVTNVKTGEILAMANYPDFSPGDLSGSEPPPANMINHVTSTVYEPGSVFKVFTLSMGIDSGVANINTVFDTTTPLQIGNQKIRDDEKSKVNLPLWQVFTHSSNIGAARLGLLAGGDRLQTYFKSFGLYAAAPSELKESARPLVPARLSDNTVASMSFGQAISVTPLAIATGMNAIFNDGEYIPLTIRKLDPGQVPQGRRVISEQTSRTMLDLMRLNATWAQVEAPTPRRPATASAARPAPRKRRSPATMRSESAYRPSRPSSQPTALRTPNAISSSSCSTSRSRPRIVAASRWARRPRRPPPAA